MKFNQFLTEIRIPLKNPKGFLGQAIGSLANAGGLNVRIHDDDSPSSTSNTPPQDNQDSKKEKTSYQAIDGRHFVTLIQNAKPGSVQAYEVPIRARQAGVIVTAGKGKESQAVAELIKKINELKARGTAVILNTKAEDFVNYANMDQNEYRVERSNNASGVDVLYWPYGLTIV